MTNFEKLKSMPTSYEAYRLVANMKGETFLHTDYDNISNMDLFGMARELQRLFLCPPKRPIRPCGPDDKVLCWGCWRKWLSRTYKEEKS